MSIHLGHAHMILKRSITHTLQADAVKPVGAKANAPVFQIRARSIFTRAAGRSDSRKEVKQREYPVSLPKDNPPISYTSPLQHTDNERFILDMEKRRKEKSRRLTVGVLGVEGRY